MDHQQQQQQHPGQDAPVQEWQSSLFNCAPCGTCLLSSCLPCILIGRTSGRMRDPSMETFEELNSECIIFGAIHCFTGCGWIYSMMKRGEIRDRYGIKGSDCGDCCVSFCCMCCAMIQQDKEVKLRTAGQPPPITQGYQSQKEGMQMPPPGYEHQGQKEGIQMPAPGYQHHQQSPMMQPEHQTQQQQPIQQQPIQQQHMQHQPV